MALCCQTANSLSDVYRQKSICTPVCKWTFFKSLQFKTKTKWCKHQFLQWIRGFYWIMSVKQWLRCHFLPPSFPSENKTDSKVVSVLPTSFRGVMDAVTRWTESSNVKFHGTILEYWRRRKTRKVVPFVYERSHAKCYDDVYLWW